MAPTRNTSTRRTTIAKAGALAAVALASSAQGASAYVVVGDQAVGYIPDLQPAVPIPAPRYGGGGLAFGASASASLSASVSGGLGLGRRFLREMPAAKEAKVEQQAEEGLPEPVESTDVFGNGAAMPPVDDATAEAEAEKAATDAVFEDSSEPEPLSTTGRALKDFDLDDLPDRLRIGSAGPIGIGGVRGWRFGDGDDDDDKRRKLMSNDNDDDDNDNDRDDDRDDDNDRDDDDDKRRKLMSNDGDDNDDDNDRYDDRDDDNDRDDNDDDKRRRRLMSVASTVRTTDEVGAYAGPEGAFGYHYVPPSGSSYYRSSYYRQYGGYPYNIVGGGPGRMMVPTGYAVAGNARYYE